MKRFTHRRGCGVVTTIREADIRALISFPEATDADRKHGAAVLALAVDDEYSFTSERDGLTVKFRRVE